jgi:hypothetical protein
VVDNRLEIAVMLFFFRSGFSDGSGDVCESSPQRGERGAHPVIFKGLRKILILDGLKESGQIPVRFFNIMNKRINLIDDDRSSDEKSCIKLCAEKECKEKKNEGREDYYPDNTNEAERFIDHIFPVCDKEMF